MSTVDGLGGGGYDALQNETANALEMVQDVAEVDSGSVAAEPDGVDASAAEPAATHQGAIASRNFSASVLEGLVRSSFAADLTVGADLSSGGVDTEAQSLIDKHTKFGNLDERALAAELREVAAKDPRRAAKLARAVMGKLSSSDRDDVAEVFVNYLPKDTLTALARTDEGAALLTEMRGELDSGYTNDAETGAMSKIDQAIIDAGTAIMNDKSDPDLSTDEGVRSFLKSWMQVDDDPSTTTDRARCQSNAAMAALLLKGGPKRLADGLQKVVDETKKRLKSETDPKRRARLESAVRDLETTVTGLRKGNVTRDQLDKAADALVRTYGDYPTVPKGKVWSAGGRFQRGGMKAENTLHMEKTLGLTGAGKETEIKGSKPGEVAKKVWDSIPNGGSAHVSANQAGAAVGGGRGPNGEPILSDPRGRRYYETGDGRRYVDKQLAGKPNHVIVFGKDEDGKRYIYDPGGVPPYMSEDNPNFEEKARKAIGSDKKGPYTWVTPYDK